MQVGSLGAVALPWQVCEPAAVAAVVQGTPQGIDAMLDQRQAAGHTLKMGQGEAVGHTGGLQGFAAGRGRQAALCIEATEAVWQPRSPGERQQALPFCLQPGGMYGGTQPTARGQIGVIMG